MPPRPIATPRHHALRLMAVAVAASLAGCAGLTPRDSALPDTPVPAQWSAAPEAQTAPPAAQWWEQFNDSQLTALITQALQANNDVRGAQAALQQARALRDVQAAGLRPTVDASASAQRSQQGDAAATNRFRAGFDASWEPDVFGRQRSAVNAAEADAGAAVFSLANVQVSIAAEVATNYVQLRGLQTRLAIAQRNLASQEETLQLTRWRTQAGLATSLDVEQARAASEQTRAQIPALETGIDQARHALAVLTGQPPAALQTTLAEPGPVPRPPDALALSFPAETLRQRPDVRAAEQRVTAALARVSQAEAARYPSFQLSGSLGLSALTLGTLGDSASVLRSLLASVSLPLFDGGARRAQVRAQEAALAQAQVNYQATVLSALKDVEDALVALRGDRERLARLESAAEAAANAALMAQQRYASGLIDFQAVLETQRTQLNTQDSVANTTATLSADHVRLYKALGGGWPSAPTP